MRRQIGTEATPGQPRGHTRVGSLPDPVPQGTQTHLHLDLGRLRVLLGSLHVEVLLAPQVVGMRVLERLLALPRRVLLALHLVAHPHQLVPPVGDPALEQLCTPRRAEVPSSVSARASRERQGPGTAHLDPVLELDLLGLERAQVVRVLPEAELGLAQLVDVRLPVVEDADARVELLRDGFAGDAVSEERGQGGGNGGDARGSIARAH